MTCTQCNAYHDEIAFVMQKIIDCEYDGHETIVVNEDVSTSDGSMTFDFE